MLKVVWQVLEPMVYTSFLKKETIYSSEVYLPASPCGVIIHFTAVRTSNRVWYTVISSDEFNTEELLLHTGISQIRYWSNYTSKDTATIMEIVVSLREK